MAATGLEIRRVDANAFSSVRAKLNVYPTPHLDQHSARPYLRLP